MKFPKLDLRKKLNTVTDSEGNVFTAEKVANGYIVNCKGYENRFCFADDTKVIFEGFMSKDYRKEIDRILNKWAAEKAEPVVAEPVVAEPVVAEPVVAEPVVAENNIKLITFDHNVYYDTDLSQMFYDDFINNVDGYHDIQKFKDYLVIYGGDVSRNDKHFNEDEILKMTDNELNELSSVLCLDCDIDDKDDLIEELLSLDHEDYYNKYYAETYYRDLEYTFSFNGYSQEDSYKVQTVGTIETWLTDDYLTHIFYDVPIGGMINICINGELVNEILTYEFIKDEYAVYDKDDFIEELSKYIDDLEYKDLLIEYLEDNLKEYLDYI